MAQSLGGTIPARLEPIIVGFDLFVAGSARRVHSVEQNAMSAISRDARPVLGRMILPLLHTPHQSHRCSCLQ